MANVTVNGKNYTGVNEVRLPVTGSSAKQSFIIPEGTRSITANGNYDISGYANAQVEVPASGIIPSGTRYITANGTYDVTEYATAEVNVSGGGGGSTLQEKTGTFTIDQWGEATVNCGFDPDIFIIFVGDFEDDGRTYDATMCVSFADLKAGHYATAMAYEVEDSDNVAFLDVYFDSPRDGVVVFWMYANDWNWNYEQITNRTFSYKAIKINR